MRYQHSRLGRCIFAGLLLAVGMANAKGQDEQHWNYKRHVQAGIGWGRFYHGDGLVGSGKEWAGAFGIKPFAGRFRRLGFEVQGDYLGLGYERGKNFNSGHVTCFVGNALYHFSDSRLQPYVVGGLGRLKADYTQLIKGGAVAGSSDDYVDTVNTQKMLLNLGAGLKAHIVGGFAVRPELRFYNTTIGSGYNFGSIRLSVGVGYYW